jgi:hypothetical protein
MLDGIVFNYPAIAAIIGLYYFFREEMDGVIEKVIGMVFIGAIVGMIFGPAISFTDVFLPV